MDPVFIQVLSAIPILNYFADFYHEVIPEADARTANWVFMTSPDIPVSIILAYLSIIVILGPCCIRHIKVPQVNNVLVVYNSFVLSLNLWLGISLTWHILKANYQLSCQKVSTIGDNENAIASLLWIFHCSKIIELIDTLFHVLKRKGHQLTFLHLYHHSTIVFATWMGVRFVPGGSSAVIAMVNSWIHVFMYFYYEMMVLKIKTFRNYKKIVTILQIVQFLATILHCTTALRKDCGYPKWILTWLLLYMISFLVLFLHFYVQTYWKPKKGSTPSLENLCNKKSKGKDDEIETSTVCRDKTHVQISAFSEDEEEDEGSKKALNGDSAHFPCTQTTPTVVNGDQNNINCVLDVLQLNERDEIVYSDSESKSETSNMSSDESENEDNDRDFVINHFSSSTIN